MAELKTQKNEASVDEFLAGVEHPRRREDAAVIRALMEEITGCPATMWGASLVGYGSATLRYASGKTGQWFEVGFSPRKQNLVLYIMPGFSSYEALMSRLGKHRTGKSCLYINKLDDVDLGVLPQIVGSILA